MVTAPKPEALPSGETCAAARAVVRYALERGIIEANDATWAYNTLIAAVGDDGSQGAAAGAGDRFESPTDALLALATAAQANGCAPQAGDGADGVRAWLMGLIMPRPSEVARSFEARRAASPEAATDWLYALSCDTGYVHRAAIARNVKWITPTRWGELEMTINLSKPEKDPRAIAAAARVSASRCAAGGAGTAQAPYPACALCMDNEGYAGRPAGSPSGAHAARQNLRIAPIDLCGERWGLQYSPYAYFDEHCIAIAPEHRPMHIDRSTFERLLAFVRAFPHYFVGSNADLPIVGGSILSHDHFQGGRHVFPMQKAPVAREVDLHAHGVRAGVVKWPLSVLRLESADADALVDSACHVLDAWRTWDDAEAGIVSHEGGQRHNTVTPIARRVNDGYVLDLALRCNATSSARPLGVFHPRPSLHHIKKENIGLIEVMGLAILPARLKRELAAVEQALCAGDLDALDHGDAAPHADWAREVAARHPELCEDNVSDIVRAEVGAAFAQVLEDAGVFKWDDAGRAALDRFLRAL